MTLVWSKTKSPAAGDDPRGAGKTGAKPQHLRTFVHARSFSESRFAREFSRASRPAGEIARNFIEYRRRSTIMRYVRAHPLTIALLGSALADRNFVHVERQKQYKRVPPSGYSYSNSDSRPSATNRARVSHHALAEPAATAIALSNFCAASNRPAK